MSHKALSADELYKSYRAYEKQIDKQVKAGEISNNQARLYLNKARKSYKDQNYNKYLSRLK